MNQPKLFCVCMAACSIPAATSNALAHGFRLPDQDAFATARGEAFAATADNASAVYYNPAGLGQLRGNEVRAGVYGLDFDLSYTSPSGQEFHSRKDLAAAPQIFYAYGAEGLPLSFGLGLYSPYGLSSEWPQNTGFRTIGTEARLTYFTLNPVVAWRVLPSLSLAAGLTLNDSQADLQRGMFWPMQSYDNFRFKGDGTDVGYNLGLQWHPIEQLVFGAVFRSPTTIKMEGETIYRNDVPLPLPGGGAIPAFPEQRVGADATFRFPLSFVLGVSYRPTPAWNVEFNADYTDWSRLESVTIHQNQAFPPFLPQDLPLTLQWDSSWYYEFGVTRYLPHGWSVSAGYIYNENSVPDGNYLPQVGDLDRHFFTVGTGFKGQHFEFDAAYQFGYAPTRTVSGSALSATGQSADGNYDFTSHALMLTVGWHF